MRHDTTQLTRHDGLTRHDTTQHDRRDTTRHDTIFGATFMVVAPEHPLVAAVLERDGNDALRAYVEAAGAKSDVDRMAETKEKTGVATGVHAINPATGETIPVWTADYVLMGYGHGAIMAVPGHDQRDIDFANAFGLPIVQVIESDDATFSTTEATILDGRAVNSSGA